ncbi:hypothetical protein AAVH_18876 [Aphelenchoides avenae]|nr:hypothetical protein AAVH_18876 [Aphelenchus avenae]
MRFVCLLLCLILGVVSTEDSAGRSKRSPLLGNLLGGNIPLIGGLLGGGGGNAPKPTTTTPKPTTAGKLNLSRNMLSTVSRPVARGSTKKPTLGICIAMS